VSVVVDGSTDGGKVCNDASRKGESPTVKVVIGTDPVTGAPIYKDFPYVEGVDLSASSCVLIGAEQHQPNFCTYTHLICWSVSRLCCRRFRLYSIRSDIRMRRCEPTP
jgi:hypothetical protein